MSFVEFKEVTKTYTMGSVKVHAVHNMNFSIEEGEICVIVGPSGAGKTTVLNMLGGMDTCTSGSIYLDGKEIGGLSEKERTLYRRHDIGFVFQFYNLVPNLTAKENVELASQICLDPMQPEDALRAVGLEHRMDNFPAQLSGGEQQRVSIARALAKNPTGKQILKLLQDMCKEQHKTVAIVTHNFAFTQIADRVIHVKEGQAQSVEINQHPADALTVEW